MSLPLVIAVTGASGVIYGIEALRTLRRLQQPTCLILSESAIKNITLETDVSLEEVRELADTVYNNKNLGAAVASGSFRTRGMLVAPCSIKTLSAIANAFSYNLIARAADVTLKEGRKLVLMVRETPLHKGHLDLMGKVAEIGGTILPPVPAFYHAPSSVLDIVHQSVGKALDQFDIEHDLYRRWSGETPGKRGVGSIGLE
ncbi:MAG: UbiX family flavin prenyltransferase [Gammaproteobacteria bacterium]